MLLPRSPMDATSQPKLTPARLEASSDGVIAVVITIMVLELKVPRESGAAGLRGLLPILLGYGLSFAFTGIGRKSLPWRGVR